MQTSILAEIETALRTEAPKHKWQPIAKEMANEQRALVQENRVPPKDRQSQSFVEISSLILAAYKVLCRVTQDKMKSLDIVGNAVRLAFIPGVPVHLEKRLGINKESPGDAFDRISENFKSGGEARFGAGFIYEQEIKNETESFVNVKRCFFNDYMRAHGVPELTPVFCALDTVWAEEISKSKYQVDFQRPTLLSFGDDACRFQFKRASTKTDLVDD